MDANAAFDVDSGRAARVAALRSAITAGEYAPDVDDVAESLVGWIAVPAQFDGPVKFRSGDVDREIHTAADHQTRR